MNHFFLPSLPPSLYPSNHLSVHPLIYSSRHPTSIWDPQSQRLMRRATLSGKKNVWNSALNIVHCALCIVRNCHITHPFAVLCGLLMYDGGGWGRCRLPLVLALFVDDTVVSKRGRCVHNPGEATEVGVQERQDSRCAEQAFAWECRERIIEVVCKQRMGTRLPRGVPLGASIQVLTLSVQERRSDQHTPPCSRRRPSSRPRRSTWDHRRPSQDE